MGVAFPCFQVEQEKAREGKHDHTFREKIHIKKWAGQQDAGYQKGQDHAQQSGRINQSEGSGMFILFDVLRHEVEHPEAVHVEVKRPHRHGQKESDDLGGGSQYHRIREGKEEHQKEEPLEGGFLEKSAKTKIENRAGNRGTADQKAGHSVGKAVACHHKRGDVGQDAVEHRPKKYEQEQQGDVAVLKCEFACHAEVFHDDLRSEDIEVVEPVLPAQDDGRQVLDQTQPLFFLLEDELLDAEVVEHEVLVMRVVQVFHEIRTGGKRIIQQHVEGGKAPDRPLGVGCVGADHPEVRDAVEVIDPLIGIIQVHSDVVGKIGR